MEHNAIQWLGAPSCQRGSYAFYKSVGSKTGAEGPVRVWRLGEFYFVRCAPGDPVCIAEVTLLWEDQAQRHLLASARLYFLPEDTPKGRTREHGEDEVLAVSRKMVLRVEDLVRWSSTEPLGWIPAPNGLNKPPQINETAVTDCKPLKDKHENGVAESQSVKVLSYPQYCRYRSLQRRIQDGARDPTLQDVHLLALGAIRVTPSTRLMYCRDTFNHPTLENNVSFTWQFRCPSLSLRGRPRKRRGRDDRDDPSTGQSESWIEKMKENVMGSVEDGGDSDWLPHPEEQMFLDELFAFMERQGSPIHKVPNLGFKKINLFLMYSVVRHLGGYEKVTSDRMWKVVYNELGGCPGSTSAATCTRRHYERLMLPYEEHLIAGGSELQIPDCAIKCAIKPRGIRGRKPLPRGRKPGPKVKAKLVVATSPSTVQITATDGSVVAVKRGRGRPPGKRNKATLLAQAKLQTQNQTKADDDSPKALLLIRNTNGLPTPNVNTQPVAQPVPSPTLPPIQPSVLPVNLPLTPDLSPLSSPFLSFPSKPELKDRVGEPVTLAPATVLSVLPRHFVGGSLAGYSPIKGLCPLDALRNRVSFQRIPESPPPLEPVRPHTTIYAIQPKRQSPASPVSSGERPSPPAHSIQPNEDSQKTAARDSATPYHPPLPPLRVLPLDLDCSVQVRQLMRSRLGSSQFQTFTRRLSEALAQDLSAKPPRSALAQDLSAKSPRSPVTPPPEQALPLNLSKRFTLKRPGTNTTAPSLAIANVTADRTSPKRSKMAHSEEVKDLSPLLGGGGTMALGVSGEGQEPGPKNQEEPADLSSPSRIRAFLLGLPPFQVKLDEDSNGTRSGSQPEIPRTSTVKKDPAETSERQPESPTQQVTNVEMLSQGLEKEVSGQMADMNKPLCDVQTSKTHLNPVVPQTGALVLAQQS
ncbi:uncharacterized protein LOC144212988 [Stigmatopora nigra]